MFLFQFDHLPFTSNDENFVEAFAIFCGMGINNVKMYETAVLALAKQQVGDPFNYNIDQFRGLCPLKISFHCSGQFSFCQLFDVYHSKGPRQDGEAMNFNTKSSWPRKNFRQKTSFLNFRLSYSIK